MFNTYVLFIFKETWISITESKVGTGDSFIEIHIVSIHIKKMIGNVSILLFILFNLIYMILSANKFKIDNISVDQTKIHFKWTFLHQYLCDTSIYIYLWNTRLRRDFPRSTGRLRRPFGKPLPSAAVKKLNKMGWHGRATRGGDIKKIGAPAAPQMVLKTGPVPWGFRIYAWFWNWTMGKWFI